MKRAIMEHLVVPWLIPIVAVIVAVVLVSLHRSSEGPPRREPTPQVLRDESRVEPPPKETPRHEAKTDANPVVTSRAKSAFDRVLEALRSGDKEKIKKALDVLLVELTPAAVPDDQNAAILYKQAFEKFDEGTPEEAEAWSSMGDGRKLTPGQRELVKSFLEKNREALKLLHEAADRPGCDFNLDYSQGFALLLPHVGPMVRAAKMLRAESILAEGDAAAESGRVSNRLAEALAGEPILISQLVRYVNNSIAAGTFDRVLDADPGADALRSILGSLDSGAMRAGLERAMIGELYMGVKWVTEGGDPENLGLEGAPRRPDDPMTAHDLAYYAETLGEYAKLLGRPYWEVRDEIDQLEKSRVDAAPWYAETTKMLLPAFGRAASNEACAEAGVDARRIGAALRLYKLRHGAYPDSLDDLGGILPKQPVDPFTGKPFVYRRDGTGFVVFSVGPEGLDDWSRAKDRGIGLRSEK